MSDYTEVTRPTRHRRRSRPFAPQTTAVLATAETGRAVRIALNGRPAEGVFNALSQTARRHNLRLHRVIEDGYITVWAYTPEPQS